MEKTDLRRKLARFALGNRWAILVVMGLITVFFAVGLVRVDVKTIFSDLFPKNHPFVQVYKDHPNFGNPLTVTLMIKRVDGKDVFQADTLEKIWRISRDIDLTPGVDHDQILSIATSKARYTVITPDGIFSQPIMDDELPKTAEQLAEIRRRVDESPGANTFLVSSDGTATIVNATFIEQSVDYHKVFDAVQAIVKNETDAAHEIHAAGFPVMTGWIYAFGDNTLEIFAITLILMFGVLAFHMRNVAGILVPVLVSTVSAIWGFGLVGWLGLPVEPLLMVVPLLLIARCFSHCVQATERYFELLHDGHPKDKAAELSLVSLVYPGTLGIFTDVCGLLLVALAPIPAMERFALFTGLWALNLVPCSVFLTPILLSLMPRPNNIEHLLGHDQHSGPVQRGIQGTLGGFAALSTGRNARYSGIVFIVLGIVAVFLMLRVQVGNPVEGTNLLRYDSKFNLAVREINRQFPGSMTMEVIFEGKEGARIVRQSDTLTTMRDLQHCLESSPNPPTATLSFADLAPEANRVFSGGNPKWSPLDNDDASASAAVTGLMAGTNAKAFLHVTDFELKNATVSLWYANNKQETVDTALAQARRCVEQVGPDHPTFQIRLASGAIALQQSINDTVVRYESRILLALNLVILIGCSLAYRSIVAGLLLLIPVNLANAMLTASMSLAGVGLDVNSLPILAIGIGVGIDYGIYLMTRICEEYQVANKDLGVAIRVALKTCGKAIFFTASLMTIGLAPWYFLSELKFLSDTGLLLVVLMLINMVLALVLLPLLVYLIKPKFLDSDMSALSESLEKKPQTAVPA
ncbi:efflux RND transporter permease subunit [Methylibium petroleiphilum]|uniref:efflux RND transporter permease subunit n=1 Tax=Methylibium petroleiphilum TaxID=105560 RepID=UPI001AC737C5|nr:MMPL family transporter [Methylibium petroleiphilum]MBN9206971.1 MMPL family transporter [Methylibium petroleiphilum]